jgi:L-seryl-tRNA(Ser) seleniumtransferase
VTFSGDKLLGGPQAGIIAGKKEFVERIRQNPLFRALRVDKLTIAALEVTLKDYARGALDKIPALRMIRLSAEEIGQRARSFCDKLRTSIPSDVSLEILPGFSVIGGGSTPDQQLKTHLIAITSPHQSPTQIEATLRRPRNAPPGAGTQPRRIPVVARIEDDRLILDLRTVFPEEEAELVAAIQSAIVKD